MSQVITVALDLATTVFQVQGAPMRRDGRFAQEMSAPDDFSLRKGP